jgi:hypothetical protein
MTGQLRDQLNRKSSSNAGASNTRRNAGDEFRRVGQQLTEMPRHNNETSNNTSSIMNNTLGNGGKHTSMIGRGANSATN